MAEQQQTGSHRPNGGGETAGQQAGAEARRQAQRMAAPVRDVAGDLADRAQQQAEAGKHRAADQMDRTSEAVRRAAQQMDGQQAWMAGLVERGADELGRLADTLRQNDLRSLLQGAEDLARRQPMLFAGGAFALGFAAMRATRAGLSAAAPRRDDTVRDAADTVGEGTGSRSGNGAAHAANPLRSNGSEARESAR
jgi:hypothetical protein